jgi:hypothetical protein
LLLLLPKKAEAEVATTKVVIAIIFFMLNQTEFKLEIKFNSSIKKSEVNLRTLRLFEQSDC